MFKRLNLIALFAITAAGLSSPASANLILITHGSGSQAPTSFFGSYKMTDFALFNVGADLENTDNNAWIAAKETVEPGIDSIDTGFENYADNSNDSCSPQSPIAAKPGYSGIGNFSGKQGSCAKVPEPSSLALLALGVIGLGFTHRKNKN